MLFSGKKQFDALFAKPPKVKMGYQEILPADWPLSPQTKVFVCPSSSGRVVMKKEDIMKYYHEAFEAYNLLTILYICSIKIQIIIYILRKEVLYKEIIILN